MIIENLQKLFVALLFGVVDALWEGWREGRSGGLGVDSILLQGDDAFSWRDVPLPY